MLGYLSKNDRPQFFFVVVGETVLRPALTPQCPMGAGRADDTPADPL